MRYCTRCRRITPGEPLYCNHCGASFDAKLCPRRHVNPREAEVCSTCGSRDLSRPAPTLGWGWRLIAWSVAWFPFLLLILLSFALFARLLEVLASNQAIQAQLIVLLLLFLLFSFLYSKLPRFIQRLIRSSYQRTKQALKNRKGKQ